MTVSHASRAFFICVASFALLLAACGGDDADDDTSAEGPPRSFLLGFSSLPRELNADAYRDALEFIGDHGDIVLIQRNVPWSEFTPGAEVGDDTARTTSAERDAIDDHGLRLFFAIDLTDGATGRDRLAGLPPSLSGRALDDPDVRAAFVTYAEYVAINYEPDFLALGVEMNLYYERNRDDFENFKSLYAQAYDVVKEASPGTQVTVTMQYEDLQGIAPTDDPHFESWELVTAFDPRLDFVGISTYPSFVFANTGSIPDNYYTQLRAFTDKPIAITEMGFSSAVSAQGLNSGSEEEQAKFVDRAIAEAARLSMPFAIWFAVWDPTYARDTAYSAFENIGLRRVDDSEKPAWERWARAAARPYRLG
jgi:hypothetical protein